MVIFMELFMKGGVFPMVEQIDASCLGPMTQTVFLENTFTLYIHTQRKYELSSRNCHLIFHEHM